MFYKIGTGLHGVWMKIKNAIYIARHYLRWPYYIERHQEYGDHDHEHTCLAVHLPNVKLTDVCPMAGRKFRVGMEDDCERCPYFCVICYEKDAKTGKKAIRFCITLGCWGLFFARFSRKNKILCGIRNSNIGGITMDLHGKKINFLGDSITEGCGTSGEEFRFTEIIRRTYGLTECRNYGIGGTRFARQTEPSELPVIDLDFCWRIRYLDCDADVVVVFGGTNDYGHGDAPFGNPSDRTPDTFCGACHTLFTGLKDRFPHAAILVITPLHRVNDTSPFGDGRTQIPKPPLAAYARTIREIAESYGLPVLDLFEMGILDPNDREICQNYVPDGLHPNDAGHVILANVIADKLKSLQ